MITLCFATNNDHKIKEAKALLGGKIEIVSLKDIGCDEELPETTDTIKGNAIQKADYVYSKYKVNCFADDSGLEVYALGNMPGVDSAIYAGVHRNSRDNINLLLSNLRGISDRRARFVTVIALSVAGQKKQFEGILEGTIADQIYGSEGFGYDPIFVPQGFDNSLAQMTLEGKNKISHRGRAVQKLIDFLDTDLIEFTSKL
jgi:XTP/dITP diphosphohydrolase